MPVRVSVAVPGVALAATLRVTFWADPAVRVSVAGCVTTPAGSPVMAIATVPENPLDGEAVMAICCVVPGTRVTVAGVEIRLKSAASCVTCGVELLPPQERSARDAKKAEHRSSVFDRECILAPWSVLGRPVRSRSAKCKLRYTYNYRELSKNCLESIEIGRVSEVRVSEVRVARLNCRSQ